MVASPPHDLNDQDDRNDRKQITADPNPRQRCREKYQQMTAVPLFPILPGPHRIDKKVQRGQQADGKLGGKKEDKKGGRQDGSSDAEPRGHEGPYENAHHQKDG